jgi:serine/threonine protein kinase
MIGTTIGSYEIRAALGEGGMGEVYRARDSKLGRDVALKILPQTFASDPDRVARFRREAQLLASLNHAHIAAIHGLEEVDGVPVLVLELVEGATLADRLVHGPIPADQALAIARQIAEALGAAHEHGIIHRDLKPANIKQRGDGVVKVLDFGLAKALDDGGSKEQDPPYGVTASPTITSPALTRVGVIMGTASYMSPEQARGRHVDRGADIWAWGCVLFEMLTGRRAFDGADTTEVIAAVVRAEPEWARLPHDTPAAVRRLLRRCLEKDPRRRLADIRDARFTLEDLLADADAPGPVAMRPSRERWLWAAALLICIAGTAALLFRGESPAPTRQMRVDITTPPTTDPVSIALSPDGEKVAFVASSEGRPMLWVRSIVTGEASALPNTDGASLPFWSPDSRSIGFFANDRLLRIDVDGGALRDLAGAPVGTGGTWSREGVILFTLVPDGPIYRVADTGGPVTPVPSPTPGFAPRSGGNRYPHFLPDGRHYLYYMAEPEVRGVYLGSLDAPERRKLFDADAAAVFMMPAQIVFVRADRLYAQRFDSTALMLEGEATPIARGVVVDAVGAAAVSASAVGSIVYRAGAANRLRRLAWFDRAGRQIGEAFPPDSDLPLNPVISPNGRQVVLTRSIGGNADLWLQDLTRSDARTRLTTAPTPDIYAIWSPDGQRIAYGTPGPKSLFGIATIPASGGTPSTVLDDRLNEIPVDWSHDGRFILYRVQEIPGGIDLWALPMDGARQPFPVSNQPTADERFGEFSPDGKWVAFESNETGRFDVYVQAFPKPVGKIPISTSGGRQARWSPDGKELFYVAPDAKLMAVSLRPRADGQIEAASPVQLFLTKVSGVTVGGSGIEYDVSRDGRFLMNTLVEQTMPMTLILNASAPPQYP